MKRGPSEENDCLDPWRKIIDASTGTRFLARTFRAVEGKGREVGRGPRACRRADGLTGCGQKAIKVETTVNVEHAGPARCEDPRYGVRRLHAHGRQGDGCMRGDVEKKLLPGAW
jgi:hypothetical protein